MKHIQHATIASSDLDSLFPHRDHRELFQEALRLVSGVWIDFASLTEQIEFTALNAAASRL